MTNDDQVLLKAEIDPIIVHFKKKEMVLIVFLIIQGTNFEQQE